MFYANFLDYEFSTQKTHSIVFLLKSDTLALALHKSLSIASFFLSRRKGMVKKNWLINSQDVLRDVFLGFSHHRLSGEIFSVVMKKIIALKKTKKRVGKDCIWLSCLDCQKLLRMQITAKHNYHITSGLNFHHKTFFRPWNFIQ